VKRKLVLFDIDGTLLLSAGAGRRAIHAALAQQGVDLARAQGIRFDGKTDPQIVCEILEASGCDAPGDPGRVSEVLSLYLTHLALDLSRHGHRSTIMPGIPPLLDRIEADAGALLGLLTGNLLDGARLKLTAAGLDSRRFLVGAYGSDHADRGRLPGIAAARAEVHFGRVPAGAEVVIIGDTPADVRCGAAIGARSVAVATGGYTVAELEAAGADWVFEDFSDVARAAEAILS
jgi:phosphoglycolate phosphatase-like HAD superfamily hydrolase